MGEQSESSSGASGKTSRGWTQYRSRHRQKSHEEAHASASGAAIPPIPDHPRVPQGEPQLVSTESGVSEVVAQLRGSRRFGYDSEFIGEHSYYPKLCVIQVATAERVYLLDPLVDLDLTPFWELLADESVEKIVHAGQQDLEPVVRFLGKPPRNVFDTQIVAGFVGCPYPSALGKLVNSLTGADLGSGLKFSQWDHRPLSDVQMQYAANDVRYLPLLHDRLVELLAEKGRETWAREECRSLSGMSLYVFDAATQRMRVRGMEMLSMRQLAVLRALLAWREEAARNEDAPPRALLKDGILLHLARWPVCAESALDRVRGLPRPIKRKYGEAIVDATRRAIEMPLPANADVPPLPESLEDRERVESFWAAVQVRCGEAGIDPMLVTSKKEISQHLRAIDAGRTPATRLCNGWRYELLAPVCGFLRPHEAGDQLAGGAEPL